MFAIQPGDRGRKRAPDGSWIMCCWDDCTRPARMEHTRCFPDARPGVDPLYPFCSELCAALHSHAPRDQHNLPIGQKSLLTR